MAEDNFDYENADENEMEMEIYTLTEEDGKESDFELIGRVDVEGQSYVALAPLDLDIDDEDEEGGFVILKVVEEDGDEVFVTIDDDDEFDRIADIFEDELMQDMDYDGDDDENENEDEEDAESEE
jgi:uncharacterized protein YrzB (UPF0473 family)